MSLAVTFGEPAQEVRLHLHRHGTSAQVQARAVLHLPAHIDPESVHVHGFRPEKVSWDVQPVHDRADGVLVEVSLPIVGDYVIGAVLDEAERTAAVLTGGRTASLLLQGTNPAPAPLPGEPPATE